MQNKKLFPLYILLPFFILFIIFRFTPVIMTGVRSIFEFKNGEWIFNNFNGFKEIVFDLDLYKAILNTLIIFSLYSIIKIPLVILAAVLVSSIGRSKKIYIKFLYLPMVVGMFAYGIIFRYMFTYDGIINSILYSLFRFKINWLGNSLASQSVLVIAMLWGSFGINVLMVSNIISKIPKNIISYARIEGASWFRILIKIILPALRPMTITLVVLALIETIGLIDVPMNLTQGGPEMATVTLGYYIYKMAFDYTKFSYAATISITIFIMILVPLAFLTRFASKRGALK